MPSSCYPIIPICNITIGTTLGGQVNHAISRVIKGRDGCRGALIRDTAIEITKLDLNIFKSDDFWGRWKDLTLNREFGWEIITDVKPVKERGISYGFILPEGHSVITGSGLLI